MVEIDQEIKGDEFGKSLGGGFDKYTISNMQQLTQLLSLRHLILVYRHKRIDRWQIMTQHTDAYHL